MSAGFESMSSTNYRLNKFREKRAQKVPESELEFAMCQALY